LIEGKLNDTVACLEAPQKTVVPLDSSMLRVRNSAHDEIKLLMLQPNK